MLQLRLIAVAVNDPHYPPFPQVVQLLPALRVVAGVDDATVVGDAVSTLLDAAC